MILFDYIFYRLHNIFKKVQNGTYTADVQSLCALSTLQWMNIFFLVNMYSYTKEKDLKISKIEIVVSILIFIFMNYLRYSRKANIKILTKKWKNEKEYKKFINGILVLIYVIATLALCVWSADFVGRYFRELKY